MMLKNIPETTSVPIDLENTDYFKIKQKIDNGDLTIADAD